MADSAKRKAARGADGDGSFRKKKASQLCGHGDKAVRASLGAVQLMPCIVVRKRY